MTERKFKVLGTTDEVTTCDCCGKSNLKATWAIEMTESGELLHYGSVCVTRNTGIKNPASAAKTYHGERMKLAQIKLRQSDEHRAKEARLALRETMKMGPGMAAYDFVREVCQAYDRKMEALKAEFDLEYFWA
jgi:hypothetical protein